LIKSQENLAKNFREQDFYLRKA